MGATGQLTTGHHAPDGSASVAAFASGVDAVVEASRATAALIRTREAGEARRRKAAEDAQAMWESLRAHIEVPDAVVVKDLIAKFSKLIAANRRASMPRPGPRGSGAAPASFAAPKAPVYGASGREAFLSKGGAPAAAR